MTTTITGVYHGPITPAPGTYVYDLSNADMIGGFAFASNLPTALYTSAIDATGKNYFQITADSYTDATVDLSGHSSWEGVFSMKAGGFLHVDGGRGSTFVNDGTSVAFANTSVRINTNVAGTGTIALGDDAPNSGLTLGFGPHITVGSGQTITMDLQGETMVQIDNPTRFHGEVVIEPVFRGANDLEAGRIDLMGLTAAASYSLKNDLLSLFNARGQTIDTLRLATSGPVSVGKNSSGDVSIYTPNIHPAGDVALSNSGGSYGD
jgi:hypothetical protein